MKNFSLPALLLISCAAGASLPVSAQGALKLTMESFQEVVTKSKDGTEERKRVPAAKVLPGNEVIYVITYHNTGSQPVTKAVINNPLPAQVTYAAGSAAGEGADLLVSVDGGKTFGVLASLRVTEPGGEERPARPSDVTHLRWTVAGTIPAGSQGSVSYRAVLK